MLDEIRKSVRSMLYERLVSPLFGTLIITWLIWNWKIVYLTIFISEEIVGNKICYIQEHYSNPIDLYVIPLVSTLLLLTAVPFVSNGAYWLHLWFKSWRSEQRTEFDKKRKMTSTEYLDVMSEINEKEEAFADIIKVKNEEIQRLNSLIAKQDEKTETNVLKHENWTARPGRHPQGATYRSLSLSSRPFEGFSCKFTPLSGYVRFGLKLTTSRNSIFGPSSILTDDVSYLVHIGRNDDNAPFMATIYEGTQQIDGYPKNVGETDESGTLLLRCEITKNNTLQFYVNNNLAVARKINFKTREQVAVIAWGDGNDFTYTISDMKYSFVE